MFFTSTSGDFNPDMTDFRTLGVFSLVPMVILIQIWLISEHWVFFTSTNGDFNPDMTDFRTLQWMDTRFLKVTELSSSHTQLTVMPVCSLIRKTSVQTDGETGRSLQDTNQAFLSKQFTVFSVGNIAFLCHELYELCYQECPVTIYCCFVFCSPGDSARKLFSFGGGSRSCVGETLVGSIVKVLNSDVFIKYYCF